MAKNTMKFDLKGVSDLLERIQKVGEIGRAHV